MLPYKTLLKNMVYKKYIQRGGKKFGPYYYESYRDKDGKVKTRYVSPPKKQKTKIPSTKLHIFLAISIVALLIFVLIATSTVPKGSRVNINENVNLADFVKNSYETISGFVVIMDDSRSRSRPSDEGSSDDESSEPSVSVESEREEREPREEEPVIAPKVVTPATCFDGMISYWRAEGDADDSLGGNDGTFAAETYTSGQVGQAFDLDGSDDYVIVHKSALTDWLNTFDTQDKTIVMWVLAKSAGGSTISATMDSDQNPSLEFPWFWDRDIDAIQFVLKDDAGNVVSYRYSVSDWELDEWHHIALAWDSTSKDYVVYLDSGTRAVTLDQSSGTIGAISQFSSAENFTFGARNTGGSIDSYFNGTIDEVAIFNRTLNSTEIQQLYNRTNSGNDYCTPLGPLPPGNIDNEGTITQPGLYKLTQDLTGIIGDAFTINVSDVIIDGMGHTIQGTGSCGVNASHQTNITVKNATYTGFLSTGSAGVCFVNVTDSLIENVNVTDNYYGISLNYSYNITVHNIIAANNSYVGIGVQASDLTNMTHLNVSMNNAAGIAVVNSTNTIIDYGNVTFNGWPLNGFGIMIVAANNTNITHINVSTNYYGINLVYANYTFISHSNVTFNDLGIYISDSNTTEVMYVNISLNNNEGIYLEYSNNTNIGYCNISFNDYGVYLDTDVNESDIYNNNIFWNNNQEIFDDSGLTLNYMFYTNQYGTIDWTDFDFLEDLTTEGNITFPGNITIGNNSAYFNPAGFTGEMDSSANITLDLNGWGITSPFILKDGFPCFDCVVLNYTNNIIVFNVSSWSLYNVTEGANTPPNVTSVILTTTNASSNDTNQNLTSYITAHDEDGDNITLAYNWYKEEEGPGFCYQETANQSTVCGGLGTGSYSVQQGYLYIDYTKPTNAQSPSIWQIKHGGRSTYNITIPSNCWSQSPLEFRVRADAAASVPQCYTGSSWTSIGNPDSVTSCDGWPPVSPSRMYDGDWDTGAGWDTNQGRWSNFYRSPCPGNLYEEAMWWNLSSGIPSYVLNATTLIENGLVAYWPLNNDTDDYWGGNDGTAQGDPILTTGKVGGSYDFDGSNDKVDIGSQTFDNRWSASAWIKTPKTGVDQYVIGRRASDSDRHFLWGLYSVDNTLFFAMYNGGSGHDGTIFSSIVINPNQWYHITVVVNETSVKQYINGVQNSSGTWTNNPASETQDTIIGGRSQNDYGVFNGSIDEVMIFNRSLSAEEIEQLYQGSAYGGNVMDSSQTEAEDVWKLGVRAGDSGNTFGAERNSSEVEILGGGCSDPNPSEDLNCTGEDVTIAGDANFTTEINYTNSNITIEGVLTIENGANVTFTNCDVNFEGLDVEEGGYVEFRHGDGTIWSNGHYNVSGTSVLNNETLRMNVTSDGEYRINVTSTGQFHVYNNSKITNGDAHPSASYDFEVYGNLSLNQSDVEWITTNGIYLHSTAEVLSLGDVSFSSIASHSIITEINLSLTGNLATSSALFKILADNLTIDLNNYNMSGGAIPNYGIDANGYDYLIIKNGSFDGFHSAIYIQNNQNATIKNINTFDNNRGFYFRYSTNITVKDSVSDSSISDAIFLLNTNNSKIINVNIINGNYGLTFSSSHNNTVINTTTDSCFLYGTWILGDKNNFINLTVDSSGSHGIVVAGNNNTIQDSTIVNNGDWEDEYGVHISSGRTKNSLISNNISFNADHGIKVEGTFTNISGNTIQRNGFNPSDTGDGINVDGVDNTTIYNNTIIENADEGIQIKYGDNNYIIANDVINNTGNGIKVEADGHVILPSTYNVIKHNNASLNGNGGHNASGIKIGDKSYRTSNHNIVFNNTCYNNTDDGISVASDYNNISSNYIEKNGRFDPGDLRWKGDGIAVDYGDYNTLINNTVVRNRDDGIELDDLATYNWVINNTINENWDDAVHIENRSTNNYVINNTMLNQQDHGIHITEWSNSTEIRGNIINRSGRAPLNKGDGMNIKTNFNLIINNTVLGGTDDGIKINGGISNTIEDNIIYNNRDKAVHLIGTINTNVTNNYLYMNSHGFVLKSNSTGNVFINNTAVNHSQQGIYIRGEYDTGNTFTNSYSCCSCGLYDIYDLDNSSFTNTTCDNSSVGSCDNACNLNCDFCEVTEINASIVLQEDYLCGGDCFIITEDDVVFDCWNYTIEGYNRDHRGVLVNGRSNITVKNCNIEDFEKGILFNNTVDSVIFNNTLTDNQKGFRFEFGSRNIAKENIIFENNDGIELESSSNNIIKNNFINNNEDDGIQVEQGSNNNTFFNNTIINHDKFEIDNQVIDRGKGIKFETNSINNILYPNNTFANNSVDFLAETDSLAFFNITNMTFEIRNSFADVRWEDRVSFNASNIENIINYSFNLVQIDSNALAELNGSAEITIYDTNSIGSNRVPLRNGVECSSSICTEILDANDYRFEVTHFTNYSVKGVGGGGSSGSCTPDCSDAGLYCIGDSFSNGCGGLCSGSLMCCIPNCVGKSAGQSDGCGGKCGGAPAPIPVPDTEKPALPPLIIGEEGCTPSFECDGWGECNIKYNIDDILHNGIVSGAKTRICSDETGCSASYLDEGACSLKEEVEAEVTTWCNSEYIEIISKETGEVLSRLKYDGEKLEVDINLIGKGYCWYCYDNEQDYDEQGLDCGGSCIDCSIEEEQPKTFLPWPFWLSLSIFVSLLILLVLVTVVRPHIPVEKIHLPNFKKKRGIFRLKTREEKEKINLMNQYKKWKKQGYDVRVLEDSARSLRKTK